MPLVSSTAFYQPQLSFVQGKGPPVCGPPLHQYHQPGVIFFAELTQKSTKDFQNRKTYSANFLQWGRHVHPICVVSGYGR